MGWRVEKGGQSLEDIARLIRYSKHGYFVKALAQAWLHADRDDKEIIRPGWVEIIHKYNLNKESEG